MSPSIRSVTLHSINHRRKILLDSYTCIDGTHPWTGVDGKRCARLWTSCSKAECELQKEAK